MIGCFVALLGGALMASFGGAMGISASMGLMTAFWIFWHTNRLTLSYGYLCGYSIVMGYFFPDTWLLVGGIWGLCILGQRGARRFIPQKTLPALCGILVIFGVLFFWINTIGVLVMNGINIFQEGFFFSVLTHYGIEWLIIFSINIIASYGFHAVWPQKTSYLVS